MISNAAKKSFVVLTMSVRAPYITILIVQQNFKFLVLYLAKLLDTWAKLFFPCMFVYSINIQDSTDFISVWISNLCRSIDANLINHHQTYHDTEPWRIKPFENALFSTSFAAYSAPRLNQSRFIPRVWLLR